jgi:hypothetical protein
MANARVTVKFPFIVVALALWPSITGRCPSVNDRFGSIPLKKSVLAVM